MKIKPVSTMETKLGKPIIGGLAKAIAVVKQNAAGVLILLCFLLTGFSANAQSFIRFNFTQERVTVPIGSINSTVITNAVNLSGGATNANFDVSGLPSGASAVLTDTNLNPLLSTEQDTNLLLTLNTTNIPEGIYTFRLNAGGFDTNGLPVTNSLVFVLQAAHIWNGTLDNTNVWSSAGSWLGGVPSSTSDVVFGDQGSQTNVVSGIPFTNSFVDVDTTIASLRFSQTGLTNNSIATNPPPYYHHVHILAGKTLTISGTNGFSLMRDYLDDLAGLGFMGVNISGEAGSRMVVSNTIANFSMLIANQSLATLNMSNLDNLVIIANRVGIGEYQLYPNYREINNALNVGRDTNDYTGRPRNFAVNIYWAKTNVIKALYKNADNYTNEFTRSYAFSLFDNEQSGNGSSVNTSFLLGISNIFLLDSVCFYGASSAAGNTGGTRFGPTNGVAVFRGTNGTSRMSVFTVSDDGGTNEASSNLKGFVDFSAGSVDALVDRLYLSRDRELIQTNQTPNVQSDLRVGKGTFDANTAIFGFQEHTKPDWTLIGGGQPYLNYCQGRLVVTNGGTFRVNGNLTLGYTADTNDSANAVQYGTYGQITIFTNSTVMVSNIVVDGGLNFYDPSLHLTGLTPRANDITINQGGNLIVSNSIGANNYTGSLFPTFANTGLPGLPLDNLTMGQSSILTLFVSGKTNVFVRNFVSTGITPGTIKIASLPAGLSYPTNLPLIHYQSATPVLAANMSAIGGGVQGYILNDSANQNIVLFLTTNAPNTLIWTGNQNDNWDLSSKNWVTAVGGLVTNFSMGDIAIFDDSSSVTTVNITEVVVPNQATNGVVITNSARIYTFNAAGGAIAGTAKILKQGTNTVIFNAAEAGPITVTAGEIDVSGSGILGNTTLSSNTVLNVAGGGSVLAGLNSTVAIVTVANGGSISGPIVLQGGSLVNDGTISVPTGSVLVQTNNAVLTNNADGIMNFGSSNPSWDAYAGTTIANFGTIYCSGGRIFTRGLFFGNGTFYDPVNSGPQNGSLARFEIRSDPNAVLSVGATPSGSIGNMFVQGRFDLSDNAGLNNAGGKFLVEVDTVNHINDSITATRWNNLGGCYWVMTNLTGTFQSGQSFNVLVNANGAGISNFVDTATLYPTVLPTVPGPGLQWNLSGLQNYGTIGVTNSTMVWDGGGTGNWNTNGDTGVWKSGQTYGNNRGAVFDDSASGSTTVTLTTPVAPAGINVVAVTNIVVGVSTNVVVTVSQPAFMPGIVVSNAAKDYTFLASGLSNRITGLTGIYKTGPGTLTVLSSNDFMGGLTIDGGTFAMTNSTALGVANGTALNGGISLPAGVSAGQANQIYNQVLMDNNATVKFFGTNSQNLNHFVTINQNGGTFEVSSNTALLTLNDNVLGTGALTKTGLGTLVLSQSGDLYPGGTIVNAGTLRLTAAAAGFGGVTLANNSALELTNGVGGTSLGITLTNAINITGAGTAINILGVSTNISSGPWSGSGTVTITTTNAANLFVFNGDVSGFSGTVSFGTSSSSFRFNNRTNDNPCTGSASAAFNLGTGSASLNNFNGGGLTYNLGALAGGPNTTLSGRGSNSTVWAATTIYSIGANGSSTTFSGKITNGLDTVSVVKVGSGALLLNGNSTYTGSTTVSNGTLGGSGSIAGSLTVVSGATLAPGATIGTFSVGGAATLAGGVVLELNRTNTPATNDMLVVTGTITATGPLVVTNIGPDIYNGSKFQLFNKAVTGWSSKTLPAKDPTGVKTYTWTDNIGVNGSITLASGGANPVNTNPTNITFSVSGSALTLSWPTDHIGWQLWSNSVSLLRTDMWFQIAGSTATNQMIFTLDPAKTNVFFRLSLPTP
jgi:autotransporter-associated beta strand protein